MRTKTIAAKACTAVLLALAAALLGAAPAAADTPVTGGDVIYVGGVRCVVAFTAQDGGQTFLIVSPSCSGTDHPGVIPTPAGYVAVGGVQGTPLGGSTEAPIGASVCSPGQTTGWHCGTLTAKNQTVNYPEGTVYGLSRTTLCLEPGDQGAPVVAGNQAQGVQFGGAGSCAGGGSSFFWPVDDILATYGVSLML